MSDDQLSPEPHTGSISHTFRCIIRVENSRAMEDSVTFPATILFYLRRKVAQQTTCQAPWGDHSPCLHSLFLPWLLASPLRVLSCLTSWVRLTLADISSSSEPRLLPAAEEQIYHTQMCATCLPPSPVPPRHCHHQSPLWHVAQREAVIPPPSLLS